MHAGYQRCSCHSSGNKKTKPQSRSFVFFDKFVFSFFVARPVESPLRIFGFPQPAFAIVVPNFTAVHEIHPPSDKKLSRLSVCFVEPRTEYSLPSYLIADCNYSRLVPCDRKRPSSLPYPLNALTRYSCKWIRVYPFASLFQTRHISTKHLVISR